MVLALVASMLAGCAEINKRGGVVAEMEDYVLFKAQTKSHRLFRSYTLIGVLMAAARQGGHNQADRSAIEGSLKEALRVAFETYACLYPNSAALGADGVNPSIHSWIGAATKTGDSTTAFRVTDIDEPANCQFFDEKMARLDYALYRLALSALFNEQTNTQLSSIRDKLIGEVPVISATAKAAIFGVKAVNQATTIVDDLLNLSFSSLGPVIALLPLYRDALELNMWVIMTSLNKWCHLNVGSDTARIINADGTPALTNMEPCDKRDYVYYILNRGGGNLSLWRNFVWHMNYENPYIEAYAPHFLLVTRFIWRSCNNYLIQAECTALMKDALSYAKGQSLQIGVSFTNPRNDRIDTVSRPSSTRVVRRPGHGHDSPSDPARSGRDTDPTGSIVRPTLPAVPTPQ
ncbi:MAG: hypothetical protein NT113_24470 [Hyphomicrobiales bacterium]|nr:hypothetical protein [Hyphomicrobiales bacterium]